MPRRARRAVDDAIYHVLNRGNCRMKIFDKAGDFAAFVKLLEQGRQRTDMRILAYCLMHNHWHLVLWPRRGADLSRFMGSISTTHVRRWREHRGNTGEGRRRWGQRAAGGLADSAPAQLARAGEPAAARRQARAAADQRQAGPSLRRRPMGRGHRGPAGSPEHPARPLAARQEGQGRPPTKIPGPVRAEVTVSPFPHLQSGWF